MFGDGFKFVEGEVTTAVLDGDGKLTLKREAGTIEVWESWKDYLRDLGEKPTTSSDASVVLNQLSVLLGEPQELGRRVTGETKVKNAEKKPVAAKKQEIVNIKAELKTKKAPAAAKAPKASPAEMNDCQCGCGGKTMKTFCPGHDARVHGWAKKLAAGTIKKSEIPAIALKWIQKNAH